MTIHAPAEACAVALLMPFFVSPCVFAQNSASSPNRPVPSFRIADFLGVSIQKHRGDQAPPITAPQVGTKLITVWKGGTLGEAARAIGPSLQALNSARRNWVTG